jgi:hypothetical protein
LSTFMIPADHCYWLIELLRWPSSQRSFSSSHLP